MSDGRAEEPATETFETDPAAEAATEEEQAATTEEPKPPAAGGSERERPGREPPAGTLLDRLPPWTGGAVAAILATGFVALAIVALAKAEDWTEAAVVYVSAFGLAAAIVGALLAAAVLRPQLRDARVKAEDAEARAQREGLAAALARGKARADRERTRRRVVEGLVAAGASADSPELAAARAAFDEDE